MDKFITSLIPPILFAMLKGICWQFYGTIMVTGRFKSYAAAKEWLDRRGKTDYSAADIVEFAAKGIQELRAKNSTGIAEYNLPIAFALQFALKELGGHVDVLDFGGSLGSVYFKNRRLFDGCDLSWNVVEQKGHVDYGKKNIPEITFHYSIDDYFAAGRNNSICLLSSVLQYLDHPYAILDDVISRKFKFIILDRSIFNYEPGTRIGIQHVPAAIYKAQYPVTLLPEDELKERIRRAGYEIISEWPSIDLIPVKGRFGFVHEVRSRGFLARAVE